MSSSSKRDRALLAGETPVTEEGKAMAAGDCDMPAHLDINPVASEAAPTVTAPPVEPDPDPEEE